MEKAIEIVFQTGDWVQSKEGGPPLQLWVQFGTELHCVDYSTRVVLKVIIEADSVVLLYSPKSAALNQRRPK